MPKRTTKPKDQTIVKRDLSKDIFWALIRDTVYVLVAMISIRALELVASYLGEGNGSTVQFMLGTSNSFYLAVYVLTVICSLIKIVIRSISEVSDEFDNLRAARKKKNGKLDKSSHK